MSDQLKFHLVHFMEDSSVGDIFRKSVAPPVEEEEGATPPKEKEGGAPSEEKEGGAPHEEEEVGAPPEEEHRARKRKVEKQEEGRGGKAGRFQQTGSFQLSGTPLQVESLNIKITEKYALIKKEKATVLQLKKIGRKFREQKESEEKKVKALEKEKIRWRSWQEKMEEELAKKLTEGASGAVSPTQGDDRTQRLLEERVATLEERVATLEERVATLETETERLEAENTELKETGAVKEEKVKQVLKNARIKIQKSEDEKKNLEGEKKSLEAKLEQVSIIDIEMEQISGAGASEEQDLRHKINMSQLKFIKEDKERLVGELVRSKQERQRLEEQAKLEDLRLRAIMSQVKSTNEDNETLEGELARSYQTTEQLKAENSNLKENGAMKEEMVKQQVAELQEEVNVLRNARNKIQISEDVKKELEAETKQLKAENTELEEERAQCIIHKSEEMDKNMKLMKEMQEAVASAEGASGAMKKDSENAEELTKVIKELETATQTSTAKAAEVESLNIKIKEKDAFIVKEKATILQLKKIGRKFREQKESEEMKVKALEKENKKMDEELTKKATEGASGEVIQKSEGMDKNMKLVKELQEAVECRVCLVVPREGPVPCCPSGHITCSPCLGRLRAKGNMDCPNCRLPMGEGKSALAKIVIENMEHKCSFQGCDERVPFKAFEGHQVTCKYRKVICPGSNENCREIMPFCKVEEHADACQMISIDKQIEKGRPFNLPESMVQSLDPMSCKSVMFKADAGAVFFLRTKRSNKVFTLEVVMLGTQEECENYTVAVSIKKPDTKKTVFQAHFTPRSIINTNVTSNFCLTFDQESLSHVWRLNKENMNMVFLVSAEIQTL